MIEGLRWIKTNWSQGNHGYRVVVYSDSEFTIQTANGLYPRKSNIELYVALEEAQRGMRVEYRWRERNSTDFMTFCDGVCGPLRKMMIAHMSKVAADPRAPEVDMPKLELPEEKE